MFASPKTLMTAIGILLVASLVYLEISKLPEPKDPEPACRKTDIIRVKPGIIERTEEEGKYVYVSRKWETVMTDEKEEIGFWLALCKSPDGWVELRDAETGAFIRKFVIDLNYRATHGLPVK